MDKEDKDTHAICKLRLLPPKKLFNKSGNVYGEPKQRYQDMANCFARVQFVKRSEGKNACAKSAYISRNKVHFDGHRFQEAQTFNWSRLARPVYHDILLPSHARECLKNSEILWNLCESFENRKNSQPSFELVLALPDDRIISIEDRKFLLKTFVEKNFISEGFAAEVAIHQPHAKEAKDHNWHAHVLVTGRRIAEHGDTLESKKPRDFFSKLSKTKWYELWTQHQNEYFEEKGLSLRVDPIGVVPQKHLGPVRMRGQAMSLIIENESLKELNQIECTDPKVVLEKIIELKSVFVPEDVDKFLHKNVELEIVPDVRQAFWKQKEIVELLDKTTGERTFKYTTSEVVKEEAKIIRLADSIHKKTALGRKQDTDEFTTSLTEEQQVAFKNIISGKRLSCIDGHAGTGKSYLLASLTKYYQKKGFKVRAFGPDNATAKVLCEKGFKDSQNIYKFLFSHHYGNRNISKGREVWILDEAAKLGNKPLLEFLKLADKSKAQLILSGSASQLSSVGRGVAFELFCNRYGSQTLIDIQRQKTEPQRAMAKSIAIGSVSDAVNKLCANGGLHWSATKEEAMENLISHWAEDSRHFPVSTLLIISRKNSDVRILNEMARVMRKEMGQILDQEFECETDFGKIFVSQGDIIQFRRNDRDIGVTNGLTGTLIKASTKEFVVSLKGEEEKSKMVKFDPRYYHSFQLGYASTTNRSQGSTLNRTYVNYSLGMNRKDLYVSITRHENKVHMFVSREEAKTLSRLKWYLSHSDEKLSTTKFTTQAEFERKKSDQSNWEKIEKLKESDSFLDRLKGHGRSLFGSIKRMAGDYYTSKTDRLSDQSFYKLNTSPKKKASVKEVSSIEEIFTQKDLSSTSSWESLSQDQKKAFEDYLVCSDKASLLMEAVGEEAEALGREKNKAPHFSEWQKACGLRNQKAHALLQVLNSGDLENHLGKKSAERVVEFAERCESSLQNKQNFLHQEKLPQNVSISKDVLVNLSSEQKKAIQSYRHNVQNVSMLREVAIIESEREGKDISHVKGFKEWQQACGERNKTAQELQQKLTQDELSSIFGDQWKEVITDQAKRFEEFNESSREKALSYQDLEKRLLDNIEPLLYRLFPDGPSRKERNRLRYGSKGSLCVNTSGSKEGSFYNFESQEGGGLLKLIESAQNISKKEAKQWAKDFLNISDQIKVPKHYRTQKATSSKESQWISKKPPFEAPPLDKLNGHFSKKYQEQTRYAYRDAKGDLLFYTVRLVEKDNPTNKIVLPLSYGHWKNNPNKSQWAFKQFSNTERPLYNQHLLSQKPNAPILIVEGEKSADAASQKFKGYICISWSGGSGAVSKTDWTPLKGRDIIIWPDNDQAGFKAAKAISSELRKQGVDRLRVVEECQLSQDFPEKWDLADPLPAGKTERDIKDTILLAKEKAVNPKQVLLHIRGADPNHPVYQSRANEVLWRVDERLRGELEKKYQNRPNEVHEEIINESAKILIGEKSIETKLKSEFGIGSPLSKRLSYQMMLFQAQNGKEPSSSYVESLRERIRETKWMNDLDQKVSQSIKDENIRNYVLDRTLEASMNGKVSPEKEALKLASNLVKEAERVNQREHVKANVYELEM